MERPCVASRSSLERLRAAAFGLLWLAGAALAAEAELTVTDAQGKPLSGAVVFLESPAARAAVRPQAGVEIVQVNKVFQPMVTVVTLGTAVSFPNRDTVRHHVYSFSPTKRFDLKLYVGTPASPVVFDKAGVAVLGCNIHDQMVAWVLVVDTPWFGTTNAQGKVLLKGLEPGRYQLRAWHADLPVGAPASTQPLSVTNSPVRATVQLSLTPT
jgi:plastocyanin